MENKVNMSAKGADDKQLTVQHAQALLDYQKTRKQDHWTVADANYTVVNGKIEPKPGTGNDSPSKK